MIKFSFLTTFLLLSITFLTNAQLRPVYQADDILIRAKVAQDPTIFQRYQEYEANLKLFIKSINENASIKTDTLINGRKIMPVVVHVIHKYGVENISDEQIIDGIERITIDYNKLNADTASTFPLFQSRAADCDIEFRLARIDPNGNCTNGIVRHFDPETNFAYFAIMKEFHWATDKYLNVFTVNFISPEGMSLPDGALIGGMSPFPPSNTLSQALTGGDVDIDGVLIRHDGVGSIGTAEGFGGMPINALNRTFTHELGHYFNLYHPFQVTYGTLLGFDGCGPAFLGCGDEVDDTPPVATASQNTSLSCITPGLNNTCTSDNEPDMVENYMDYQFGYCTNIFTEGQKERIDATLMGDRRNLWSIENLTATGVLNISSPHACEPIPDFNTNSQFICPGTTINLTDFSYNGVPTSWLWECIGASPSSSTDQNPSFTFDTPGVYSVTLTSSNALGSNTATKTNYIHVMDPTQNALAPIHESFENGIQTGEWVVYNENGNGWSVTDTTAYEGSKCIRIKNFSGNAGNSIDAISTPGFNLSALNPSNYLRLKFAYAYAGKITAASIAADADTSFDKSLTLYVSLDCGKTWTQKWTKTGINLATANPVETEFKPNGISEWRADSIPFQVYLTNAVENVRIKFVFTSNYGNSVYLDNIVLDNTVVTSAEEFFTEMLEFNIFPNPAKDQTNLNFNLYESTNVLVKVYDVLGKEVVINNSKLERGNQSIAIESNKLSGKGIYFVHTTINDFTYIKKLVIE